MTSIGQKYRLAKEYERDMGYVQKERDGRERLSDNVGQWLASEARRVKFTSPGAELAASSKPEGLPKGHPNEPTVTKGRVSIETHGPQWFEENVEGPTVSERPDQGCDFREPQGQREGPGDATDPFVAVSEGPKLERDKLESEDLISQSENEVKNLEVAWATRSVPKHSTPSTDLESHILGEPYCGITESDVSIRGLECLSFGFSNSLSGSGISFQRYPTSFEIASQGLGTQFERSPSTSCSPESLTLPTKDEAESISDGVTHAHAFMSYIESMNKDVGGRLLCSKDRGGSQVPDDVSHIDSGLENLDEMEDGGGWHKLPSQ